MDTILIIDDTPENVTILLHMLSDVGFKVLVAQNGQEGIKRATLAHPDLILLDVIMPDMDGFEVCNRLKAQEDLKNIPIIFMTAMNQTSYKITGFEVGAADYITKPFHHPELLARITAHLKPHKLQQQLSKQNLQFKQLNEQLQQELLKRKQAESELEQALEALQAEKNLLSVHVEERTVELKKANTELTRALRIKEEFLANMSHELRTPLTAILGISEELQEKIYGTLNDKQIKSLCTIKDRGHHLLALINDILDLSKIDADKLILNIDNVSVNDVCQTSLQMTKEAAYQKHILVSTTFKSVVESIQADERRLIQILVNLLSNAVKFTPEGGSIQLEVKGNIEQNRVQFSVQDTGIGIAEEDIEQTFEAFVQLDGALNRMQEGTGLGLSLVDRLTKMHGGEVFVESQVGKGSCFTVSLPWKTQNAHFESN
ncbi:MAG: hybrid sensor histidine kinase/response regulator [Candidatus Parabeggiatoa sp.]|nr:hybrid sensor histidine kinase/response regulator [Candidatus Parabeggiatoa sp.]